MSEIGNQDSEYNVDDLVFNYQAGDQEAGQKILEIYGGNPLEESLTKFLGKYYKMLRFGKFDFKDYDSRSFIKLFIEDGTIRSQVTKSYQYKETKRVAIRKLNQIVHSLRVVEDEDLKQELRFMLLKKAMKYKKKKRTVDFSGYIYGVYRYEVCNYIQRLLKPDELYVKRPAELMRIADDRLFDEDSNIEVEDSIFVKSPTIQMDEEIGNSWVRGITCGDEFKDLTPLQRMIIKLNYYDGYTDGKIADMMGIHINTIFRQRKKAGKIVEETVKRLIEEGYYE